MEVTLKMFRKRSFGFVLVIYSLLAAGPSSAEDTTAIAGTQSHTGSSSPSIADSAWTTILANVPTVERRSDETHYQRFLREVELTRQHIRQAGLGFWKQHPNDPRRYSWLIYTVYLDPIYPADIDAWTRAESSFQYSYPEAATQLSSVRVPTNQEQVRFWNSVYPSLRAEFLSSPDVTIHQRRIFRYAEALTALWRQKRNFARKVESSYDRSRVNAILALYRDDPGAYEYWTARNIVTEVCYNHSILGLSESDLQEFVNQFGKISRETKLFVDEFFREFCDSQLADIAARRYAEAWPWNVANGVLVNLGDFDAPEAVYIESFIDEEVARRRQEMGSHLWADDENTHTRWAWLRHVSLSPSRFYRDIASGTRDSATGMQRGYQNTVYARDSEAQAEWDRRFSQHLYQFASEPDVPRAMVAELNGEILRYQGYLEAQKVRSQDPAADIDALLERLQAYFDEYGEDSVPYVFRTLRSIIKRKSLFRIEDEYLLNYIRSFDNEKLDDLSAVLRHKQSASLLYS